MLTTDASTTQPLRPFEPRRALRAIDALLKNPDDTSQVFTIIQSLSGPTDDRLLRRFQRTDSGARLLRDRPSIINVLRDRASLAALPDGSLGRAYLDFVDAEHITADGLVAACEQGAMADAEQPGDLQYLLMRMRDTHDLWHALTGYKGDILGETSLLAFTMAQTRNPGVGLITAAAMMRMDVKGARALIVNGFARGLRASWLPAQEWEQLLPLPVDEVRARLHIDAPPSYTPLRTSDEAFGTRARWFGFGRNAGN